MTQSVSGQVARATDLLAALIERYRSAGQNRLPTELELSAELGVSRNTLREALARLELNGLVTRKPRAGTIITPAAKPASDPQATPALRYPIDSIISIPEFFSAANQEFTISSVSVREQRASAAEADAFQMDGPFDVYRVRRQYSMNGRGVAVGEHIIPKVLRGHGIHIEALTDGVSNFLSDIEHVPVEVVEHVVTARLADYALATELGVAVGVPLLDVSASLKTKEADGFLVVAVGRLLFDPTVIALQATGRAPGVQPT